MKYGDKLKQIIGHKGMLSMPTETAPYFSFSKRADGNVIIIEAGDDYVVLNAGKFGLLTIPLGLFVIFSAPQD